MLLILVLHVAIVSVCCCFPPQDPKSVKDVLTNEQVSLATSMWPIQRRNTLPGNGRQSGKVKLNKFQRKAIDIATSNNFTLIQGPPGISFHLQ